MHDAWECDYKTDNVDEFLKVFWASQCCDVFIDESGDTIGHYDKAMYAMQNAILICYRS